MDLQVGGLWSSTQRQHIGWVVRVLGLSTSSVQFRCVKGPGHSHGSVHRMRRDCFVHSFLRLGPASAATRIVA